VNQGTTTCRPEPDRLFNVLMAIGNRLADATASTGDARLAGATTHVVIAIGLVHDYQENVAGAEAGCRDRIAGGEERPS
jgi:hypothetical protein